MMGELAVSIDLGGTQLRAAVVDRSGAVLARHAVATAARENSDVVTDQIANLVGLVAKDFDPLLIRGIGVCSPGPLDTTTGVAIAVPTISTFVNFPLRDTLRRKLSMPVILENDGIAAAIGEWKFGAGNGLANVVYVTVSTGVGGGAIVDNHVLRGRKGMAGHVGHMSLVAGGTRCPCGVLGCFEAYASATAFTENAQVIRVGITAKEVFAEAENGNRTAQELIDTQAEYLGQGFSSLMHLYSPDVVIMGGGMSAQFSVLHPKIVATQKRCTMPGYSSIPIVAAALGQNSGLLGAASLVFE